jgi:hypothetical protein
MATTARNNTPTPRPDDDIIGDTEKRPSHRERIPFYASAGRRSPVIILAVDADHIGDLDNHVQKYLKRNFSVVVLVGDQFNAEPLVPAADGTVVLPEYIGKISAQPAWAWCADNLPFARNVVFVPA